MNLFTATFVVVTSVLAGYSLRGIQSEKITRAECMLKVQQTILVVTDKCKKENVPRIMLKDCQEELNDCWDRNRETPLEEIEEMVEEEMKIKDGMKR